MKKPLSKCQQCQQALEACRQLVADGGNVRDQLRQRAEYAEKRLQEAENLLLECRGALLEGANVMREGAAAARRNTLAQGAQPSWLVKDFNVLYRVALQLFDATEESPDRKVERARHSLGVQLERLKPAFTDTEEVRALMRERQARG